MIHLRIVHGSDIHINHWLPFVTNQKKWEERTRTFIRALCLATPGDVLILAGDFSEINAQTVWVLDEASKYYDRVYWTYGNHDLYLLTKTDKKKYKDSFGRLHALIEKTRYLKNVIPLICRVDTYQGRTFAGDALFYLPSQGDISFFNDVSSDSLYISLKETQYAYDAVKKLHNESLDWYNNLEEVDVLITHVPPLHFKSSIYPANSCYYTDVPELKAAHWVCGHTHIQFDSVLYGTHFHVNCIGYPLRGEKLHQPVPLKRIRFATFDI